MKNIVAFMTILNVMIAQSQSFADCGHFWKCYEQKKEEATNLGGVGTAVAMGAASFFLPVVGTLLVGGASAGAAALLDKEAEKCKQKYEGCLQEEENGRQETARRSQEERNRRVAEENKRKEEERLKREEELRRQFKNQTMSELRDEDLD